MSENERSRLLESGQSSNQLRSSRFCRFRYQYLLVAFLIISCVALVFFWPKAKPYNLIIISLDTLRADRLGIYGYARETSPAIDKLAKQGAVFENAMSVSSWTFPAHASMLSGVYPATHRAIQDVNSFINPDTPWLVDELKGRGYRTFGFTEGGYVSGFLGFTRGFDEYKNIPEYRKSKNDGLLRSLEEARSTILKLPEDHPYFIFIHSYNIHCPYEPPQPYDSRFQSDNRQIADTGCNFYRSNPGFNLEHSQYLSDRYDGAIRWSDDLLSTFINDLKSQGQLEHTIVIITSDHGEEFFDHGGIGHQLTLYREILNVPLIIVGPKIPVKKVKRTVSIVDIPATVLELLDIPVPAKMQGVSLVPFLRDEDSIIKRDAVYAAVDLLTGKRIRSIIGDTYHFIVASDGSKSELYNLSTDRREIENLALQSIELEGQWKTKLKQTMADLKEGDLP